MIVMSECESEWIYVSRGVPQRLVLDQLLFLLYLNDLPGLLKSIIEFYADDAKIIGDV